MMNDIKLAADRYRKHIDVLDNGPATQENFSRSPYYQQPYSKYPSTLHSAWWWDETQLRLDQCLLAKEYVNATTTGQETGVTGPIADELKAEVERLKKAIRSFGNGADFDWNILGRIEELEDVIRELVTVLKYVDCHIYEYPAKSHKLVKRALNVAKIVVKDFERFSP